MTRSILFVAALWLIGFAAVAYNARAHDIYHDWKTRSGVSCCHDRDCAPATATPNGDGTWWATQDGKRYFIDKHTVLPIVSPDGRTHLCVIAGAAICFVPGEARI